MSAVDVLWGRLGTEEGRRAFAYNDATSKRVTCQPGGNLTIAVGVNLEVGLDDDEINWLSQHRVQKVSDALSAYAWYSGLDEVRQSVPLDIAFNAGLHGLLGYPHMIAALASKDYATAAANCTTTTPGLQGRYENLQRILLSGQP